MIKRAKTKRNLISILSGILVAVFACMVGITFANTTSSYIYGTNPSLPNAYAANQQVKIINDTLTTPIPFGITGQGYEISIQYSMAYDFDLRLQYSLAWSGVGDEDNVILNFANRDDYIVGNGYIYKVTPVAKGEGKLTIITGVDFVDNTDESYIGQNLTINVTAEFYKKDAATYNDSHPLYVDNVAGNAWIAYKAKDLDFGLTADNIAKDTAARAIVYNYRHNVAHGLDYPSPEGAYRRLNTTDPLTTLNTKWIGGNRGYAGIGVYLITGNSAVKIKARVTGIWDSIYSINTYSGKYDGASHNSIIKANLSGLKIEAKTSLTASYTVIVESSEKDKQYQLMTNGIIGSETENVFQPIYYKITEQDGSYIEGSTTIRVYKTDTENSAIINENGDLAYENNIKYNYGYDYADDSGWKHLEWDASSKLFETCYYDKYIPANSTCYIEIVDSIEITSVSFPSEAYNNKKIVTNSIAINGTTFTGELSSKTIANETINEVTTSYLKSNVSKVNTSKYANLLMDSNSQKSFNTSLSLTNNTSKYQQVTISKYQLKYRLSNGNGTFMFDTDSDSIADSRPEELKVSNPTTYTDSVLFNNTSSVYYSVSGVKDLTGTAGSANQALTSIIIAPYSSVNILTDFIVGGALLADISDDWNASYNYDLFVEIIPTISTTTLNDDATMVSVESRVNGTTVEFYLKNNTGNTLTGVNAQVYVYTYSEAWATVNTKPADWEYAYWKYYNVENGSRIESLPDTFVRAYSRSLKANMLVNGANISDSAITLLPNESKLVKTINSVDTSNGLFVQLKSVSATIGSSSAPILVNAGTNNAMIINPTENSYYVRFSGTYAGSDTAILKSTNAGDSYNYFIGILRPGQILDIPMSATGSIDYIQYTSTSDISSWSDTFEAQIANYLK
ncbi:MAG: hypothetical protein ACLRFL_01695 [Clostridia bacterium]